MSVIDDIVLSQTDPRPMYRQIQDRIKQLVAAGDWKQGQDIPSIRQLAVGLRVSVITVKRAYLELEREGVILTRQGKGSAIAERPDLADAVRTDELRRHLAAAARLAASLGWSRGELDAALSEASEQIADDSDDESDSGETP